MDHGAIVDVITNAEVVWPHWKSEEVLRKPSLSYQQWQYAKTRRLIPREIRREIQIEEQRVTDYELKLESVNSLDVGEAI